MTDPNKEFTDRLGRSGIFSTDELSEIAKTADTATFGSPEELAFELVRQKRLTEYQASVVCGEDSRLTIGEYIVLDKIGEGGMGVVFKARQRDSTSVAAVKVLPPNTMNDQSAIRGFKREVEAASRMQHLNVVGAIDSGEDEGQHYLIMEFVNRRNLARAVKNSGPLPILTAVNCISMQPRECNTRTNKASFTATSNPATC
ncbi:MAG: hypothetical protein CMJ78_04270 [Planctomycetaceae bacterium]|nr:hypothetical protein [Planctomycetaceae bacterium]